MRHLVLIGEIIDILRADKTIDSFKEGKALGFRLGAWGCIRGRAWQCRRWKLGNLRPGCPYIGNRRGGLRRAQEATSRKCNSEAPG
jgi:hypothetical protein